MSDEKKGQRLGARNFVFNVADERIAFETWLRNRQSGPPQNFRMKFGMPDYRHLNREGYAIVDMHVHSNASHDGASSVAAILEQASKLGIGVAITDQNEIAGALEAVRRSQSDFPKKIMVIPGIEITCREGVHIMCYFWDSNELITFFKKEIFPFQFHDPCRRISRTVSETVDAVEKYHCLCGAPHPFCSGWPALMGINPAPELLARLDFMEVITSYNTKKANQAAYRLGYRGMTAGTDSHLVRLIGAAVTVAKADNSHEFLDKIASGETRVVGTEFGLLLNLMHFLVNYWNFLKTSYHDHLLGAHIREVVRSTVSFRLTAQGIKFLPPFSRD